MSQQLLKNLKALNRFKISFKNLVGFQQKSNYLNRITGFHKTSMKTQVLIGFEQSTKRSCTPLKALQKS